MLCISCCTCCAVYTVLTRPYDCAAAKEEAEQADKRRRETEEAEKKKRDAEQGSTQVADDVKLEDTVNTGTQSVLQVSHYIISSSVLNT